MREQQVEYERVQAAYAQMSAALESAAHEKRNAEAQVLDLEAHIQRGEKQARQDLSHAAKRFSSLLGGLSNV